MSKDLIESIVLLVIAIILILIYGIFDIIDETINLSIISKLLKLDIITEKRYYVLKEKIRSFY